MMATLLLIAGLVILVGGAELLVRGATHLPASFGMSPLVIGLTIVAFGTSSPELAVSLNAAWSSQSAVVIGNAIGSNTFNILVIIGLSALIVPLAVHQQIIRVDVPVMIGVGLALWWMLSDRLLQRYEAALLAVGRIAYTAAVVRLSKAEPEVVKVEYDQAFHTTNVKRARWRSAALIAGGLALCVLGSRWMVDGATRIAVALALSERVIGLTIIAAGTSLPEVATSIVAAVRGQRDIAVGNVIGSNIFNMLGILGIVGVSSPGLIVVPRGIVGFDLPVMLGASIICVPIFLTGFTIGRREGAVFFLAYAGYLVYLLTGPPS